MGLSLIKYEKPIVVVNDIRQHFDVENLWLARSIAQSVHGHQKDDGGNPYMDHIASVVNNVAHFGSNLITILATLHDILEQQDETSFNVSTKMMTAYFPVTIINGLNALTRAPNEPYKDSIHRVIQGGWKVMAVKIAELHDNLELGRFGRPLTNLEVERHTIYAWWYYHLLKVWKNLVGQPFGGIIDEKTARTWDNSSED